MKKRAFTESNMTAPEKGSEVADGDRYISQVAEMAWKHGLAPNSIAAKLGGSKDIMRVKRALARASRNGILVLKPPVMEDYRKRLQSIWKYADYTVVDDRYFSRDLDSVCMAAAAEVEDRIRHLLGASNELVVVANTGGRAVSNTVRFIQQRSPVLAAKDSERLTFLALNTAGRRRDFNQSSNFLAVRMSEIFGGQHIALLDVDAAAEEEYQQKLRAINLLICGAGGTDSLLSRHAKELHLDCPPEMAGDLAFIPLKSDGREIEDPGMESVLKGIRPQLRYSDLLRLTKSAQVLVIFDKPESKERVARAILAGGLATHCVLALTFAALLTEPQARRPSP
jgi:hypothetical protein